MIIGITGNTGTGKRVESQRVEKSKSRRGARYEMCNKKMVIRTSGY